MRYVVMFSGGTVSWGSARRIVDEHGLESVRALLFADVRIEHRDLYRFMGEAARDIGLPVTVVAEGREPWDVFDDEHFIGNARAAICSHRLKLKPCRDWLEANTDPADTTVVVGIDWTERDRLPAIEQGWAPWPVVAPMNRKPYRWKHDLEADLRARGIRPAKLYEQGYPHNNCGGACVRGGQAQWALLLRPDRERYLYNERREEAFRARHGDHAILRDRTGGETRPLPLQVFRERIEGRPDAGQGELFDQT